MLQDIAHEEALVGLVTRQAPVPIFASISRVQVVVDLAPGVSSTTTLRSKHMLESEGKERERALLQDQRMRSTTFSSLIPSLIMTVLPLSWKSSIECVISLDGDGMIPTEKMHMRNFARQWFKSSTPCMEKTSMTFRRGKTFAKLCEFSQSLMILKRAERWGSLRD